MDKIMNYTLLTICILSVVLPSLGSTAELYDLSCSLANIQLRAKIINNSTTSTQQNKSLFFQALKSEIEKSLESKETSNLNLLIKRPSVKIAKAIIKEFFESGISRSDDVFNLTTTYILLASQMTEYLLTTFSKDQHLSLLIANGPVNPIMNSIFIFALNKAGFSSLKFIILGDIDDIKNINALKNNVTQLKQLNALLMDVSIEYYETVSKLVTSDQRVDCYIANFRLTESSFIGEKEDNAMLCIQPQNREHIIKAYFLNLPQNVSVPPQPPFLISYGISSIPAHILQQFSTFKIPMQTTIADFICKPFEESLLTLTYAINRTKKKNIVPFFGYNDQLIEFAELPTNDLVYLAASIIQMSWRMRLNSSARMPLYRWVRKQSNYEKYKDI